MSRSEMAMDELNEEMERLQELNAELLETLEKIASLNPYAAGLTQAADLAIEALAKAKESNV